MGMEHDIGAVGRIGSKKPFAQPATNRDHQRGQNDDYITQHPQRANARAFALSVRPLWDRYVPGRSSSRPFVAKRFRSPDVAMDVPGRSSRRLQKCTYTLPLVRAESHNLSSYRCY